MIEVRAPGKLFIAGEYAVVEPGQPAVLVAVDRSVTVRLSDADRTGTIRSAEYGGAALGWTHGDRGPVFERDDHPYGHVVEALRTVERLRAELGLAPRPFDLRISSELDDPDGRKLGLGSSAAVTVAAVAALDRFYGLGLSRRDRFILALLATIGISPAASGGDVAASTYGGWIRYSAPDRDALRRDAETSVVEVLRSRREGLDIARLTPPDGLRLIVGWTGSPASTDRLVHDVQRYVRDAEGASFLTESRDRVDSLVAGLRTGDEHLALDAVRGARRLLVRLGARAGVAIETDRLTALCDAAESAGAAAKPSGAGGGDCGIVLAPAVADVPGMLRAWDGHGIRRLALAVHPPEGDVDDD